MISTILIGLCSEMRRLWLLQNITVNTIKHYGMFICRIADQFSIWNTYTFRTIYVIDVQNNEKKKKAWFIPEFIVTSRIYKINNFFFFIYFSP
jgi:hypothetical protein